jgi:Do/DeqQ family serine protease
MSVFTMSAARRYALPVAFVAGLATAYAVSRSEPHLSASAPLNPVVAPTTSSYADAVERAAPAVVTISVEKRAEMGGMTGMPDDSFLQRFFGPDAGQGQGQGQQGRQQRRAPQMPLEHGVGSGVIMTADGTILTNNHVVDGATHVAVELTDGREFTAKVVGTDAASDLAVVKIDAKGLPTLPVADSDRIRVGDVVLAVGNPLGIGQTVTMGIISAKGRQTDVGDNASYEDFLQTDAPINRGNSGGALITTGGELVGINSQIMSPSGGSIGIGFAIPSNMAENVMSQLVATGHVHRGLLGVTAQGLTSDMAKSLGLSSVHGAIVNDVTADSPAAAAGIKSGDVILGVNGKPISDSNDLRNRISSLAPGSHVELDVQRDNAPRKLTATLSETTANATEAPAAPKSADQTFGMSVQGLTPDLARQYRVPTGTTGLIVTDVDDSGAAARANIRPGDVIRQVDGRAVSTTTEFRDALSRRTDRPAMLSVQRQGQTFFVAIPRG